MIMRQDLECSCWWGKEHGSEIGIKRKAMELSWRKAMGEKEKCDYGRGRERHRLFFLGLEIFIECIK